MQARAAQIRDDLGNPKTIMLGVDRLDYTKGIGHRLKAFGELLAEGRLDVEDVTLVQVASPSRERVEAYQQLRDEIELTVGRINGDYGTISHQAVSYLHHGFPREEMAALYLAADVMLVTALRDGMNLVAKEYVAARFDDDGVLVLSEFTGAADELKEALLDQPARHRRAEGCDPACDRDAAARAPQAHARAAQTGARERRRALVALVPRGARRHAPRKPSRPVRRRARAAREAQTDDMSTVDQDAQSARLPRTPGRP